MPRGRLLKSKIKEAKYISKALAEGRQKADEKKPLEESLKDHIGRMIDRIDPLEAIAIIGSAIVVHEVIFKLEQFSTQMTSIIVNYPTVLWESIMYLMGKEKAEEYLKTIVPYAGGAAFPTAPDLKTEILMWLIAYAIAYYAIRHGLELLNVARMFFGFGVK